MLAAVCQPEPGHCVKARIQFECEECGQNSNNFTQVVKHNSRAHSVRAYKEPSVFVWTAGSQGTVRCIPHAAAPSTPQAPTSHISPTSPTSPAPHPASTQSLYKQARQWLPST